MPHRYFTTEVWPAEGRAVLRGADAHHLARVMRARLGDSVVLCDGNAVEYSATITANIVANAIIALAPAVPALLKAGGHFIASGIIDTRAAEVEAALAAAGLTVAARRDKRGWVCFVCK